MLSSRGTAGAILLFVVGNGLMIHSSPRINEVLWSLQTKFQWNYIDYKWPSEKIYLHEVEEDGSYIKRHNVISSIKIYKDRIYLAIPRLKRGVPMTLAFINSTVINGDTSPLLEPFPSWIYQTVGNCRMLQSVQNVEIDPKGRMWVLDSGRVMDGSEESTLSPCGPSLRILDLESGGTLSNEELRYFMIPATVADPRTAHLYDIVLDHEDSGMAYISDADPKNPGIIVFSLENGTFWRVSHSSMFASKDGIRFNMQNYYNQPALSFSLNANIHGLALSPASTAGNRTLYYSPLSSLEIYSISTSVLKNKTLYADIDSHVKTLGKKPSQSDGMVMSNTGVMYFVYGLVTDNSISTWDSKQSSFASGQRIISRDHHLLQWPASFAFDNNGSIWCLGNRMHLSLNDSIEIRDPNFRAFAARVSYTNYQYLEDGSAPALPHILMISSAGSLAFNASLALIVLLMYFMF